MSCVFVLPRPPQSPQVTPSEVSVAESEFKRKMKLFHVCCSSFCTKGGCCWCKCSPPIMNGNIYQNQHWFADTKIVHSPPYAFTAELISTLVGKFCVKSLYSEKKNFSAIDSVANSTQKSTGVRQKSRRRLLLCLGGLSQLPRWGNRPWRGCCCQQRTSNWNHAGLTQKLMFFSSFKVQEANWGQCC